MWSPTRRSAAVLSVEGALPPLGAPSPHAVAHACTFTCMQKERLTVSLDTGVAARVRQCGARTRGGASGYLERLVRRDALREAVSSAADWYARHPGYAEDAIAENEAVFGETT